MADGGFHALSVFGCVCDPVFSETVLILHREGLFVFAVGDWSEDEAMEVEVGAEHTGWYRLDWSDRDGRGIVIMTVPTPAEPSIYHIVHVDRLRSIIEEGRLLCEAEVLRREPPGTTIGMNQIKQRRLNELTLTSHPDLHVGDCVPFYFCPRSIMLYIISQANHSELLYRGGQGPIVHLEADLRQTVAWAEKHDQRWVFTLSNAGAYYFEDRCDLAQLGEIDWDAVQAIDWQQCQEGKQAEFLVERQFPWELVSRIGVLSQQVYGQVGSVLQSATHKPRVDIRTDWYY